MLDMRKLDNDNDIDNSTLKKAIEFVDKELLGLIINKKLE